MNEEGLLGKVIMLLALCVAVSIIMLLAVPMCLKFWIEDLMKKENQ